MLLIKHDQKGFTLIELSIVLVIIALVAGGVFMGQDLLSSSRIRAIIGEQDSYKKAVQLFREKYNYLPGDMPTAESFWGSDVTGGGTCPNIAATSTAHTTTCNGNGDGFITSVAGIGGSYAYESFRAWQQLNNAGFITGTYTGVTGSGGSANAVLSQNVPASQFKGTGYTITYFPNPNGASDSDNWPLTAHVLRFGIVVTNSYTYGAILRPVDALEIDTKTDDGYPMYGFTRTSKTSLYANCTYDSDGAGDMRYKVSDTSQACGLIFVMDF